MTFEDWIIEEMGSDLNRLSSSEIGLWRTAWTCSSVYAPSISFDEWVRDVVTENQFNDETGAYRELTNLEKHGMRTAWNAGLDHMMDKKPITITVTGTVGSGKTIISCALAEFFASKGITVAKFEDLDIGDDSQIPERARFIDNLSDRVEVSIKTGYVRREKP